MIIENYKMEVKSNNLNEKIKNYLKKNKKFLEELNKK
jgi:hypothetical protein